MNCFEQKSFEAGRCSERGSVGRGNKYPSAQAVGVSVVLLLLLMAQWDQVDAKPIRGKPSLFDWLKKQPNSTTTTPAMPPLPQASQQPPESAPQDDQQYLLSPTERDFAYSCLRAHNQVRYRSNMRPLAQDDLLSQYARLYSIQHVLENGTQLPLVLGDGGLRQLPETTLMAAMNSSQGEQSSNGTGTLDEDSVDSGTQTTMETSTLTSTLTSTRAPRPTPTQKPDRDYVMNWAYSTEAGVTCEELVKNYWCRASVPGSPTVSGMADLRDCIKFTNRNTYRVGCGRSFNFVQKFGVIVYCVYDRSELPQITVPQSP